MIRPHQIIEADEEKIKQTMERHNFSMIRKLGKGGFAVVYLAKSKQYQINFAIKVSIMSNDAISEDDQCEIKTMIQLSHPNIMRIYDYFTEGKYLFMVLEYCQSGSVLDLIKVYGAIKEPQLTSFIKQAMCAIEHCHSNNIAHRDIKPANMLIDQYGRIKLADFGLSSQHEKGSVIDEYRGSRAYMAPEIVMRSAYDPFAADIWALGVTFYQMMSGKLPWPYESNKEMELAISFGIISFHGLNVSKEITHLIKSMIVINIAKRATIGQLMESKFFKELDAKNSQNKNKIKHSESLIGIKYRSGSIELDKLESITEENCQENNNHNKSVHIKPSKSNEVSALFKQNIGSLEMRPRVIADPITKPKIQSAVSVRAFAPLKTSPVLRPTKSKIQLPC